ncbi:TPA: hypothetical protein ACV5T7_003570 [Salmonella enterica]
MYTNDLTLAGTIAFMLPDKFHHSSEFYLSLVWIITKLYIPNLTDLQPGQFN